MSDTAVKDTSIRSDIDELYDNIFSGKSCPRRSAWNPRTGQLVMIWKDKAPRTLGKNTVVKKGCIKESRIDKQQVLKLWLSGMNMTEIGKMVGCSQSRISTIVRKAEKAREIPVRSRAPMRRKVKR